MQEFCEVENTDPEQHQRWLDKHGFKPDEDNKFPVAEFEGKDPVLIEKLFENIRVNVSSGYYTPLYGEAYDERTFVMICGGPSLEKHLDEIRAKSLKPEEYLIVCSNMTGGYLLENGIVPHVHFILDPQEKKRYDLTRNKVSSETQYWLNVACNPAVFEALKELGIKPYVFLADFEAEGKAIQAVKESLPPGQPGMMAFQGGTMAGLRAMNLADAMGFRKLEYYGFDATVEVSEGLARPYAYEKRRGEAIIEVSCDLCPEKFNTTLIFQKQVNEFMKWRFKLPWIEISIFGGGLISHSFEHLKEIEKSIYHSPLRYTPEYEVMQRQLHSEGSYGVTGKQYVPAIFHAISQLAKKHGTVTVLDYGSATGDTMKAVREHLVIPPGVSDTNYDPFVDGLSRDPEAADLVICTDVLEHVEPDCTKAVLDHLQSVTKHLIFLSISLRMAQKVLSDGRNAHINLRQPEFWLREIAKRFITSEAKVSSDGEVLLVVAQCIEDVKQTIRKRNDLRRAA